MRKTVWKFGLISGALSVVVVAATVPLIDTRKYGAMDFLGYAAIVLSALLIFFGIRSYRETAGGGRLPFTRGLLVGVLISLVSSLCYLVAFQAAYFKLVPGLGDKYAACMVDRARDGGASPEKVEETRRQAARLKEMWDRPLTNAAVSFAQTFPLGLVASLISAVILRKK